MPVHQLYACFYCVACFLSTHRICVYVCILHTVYHYIQYIHYPFAI